VELPLDGAVTLPFDTAAGIAVVLVSCAPVEGAEKLPGPGLDGIALGVGAEVVDGPFA